MINGILSVLFATVILVPKDGKEIIKTPAATPPQDLIFEEYEAPKKPGTIEPEVVLKRVDKKKKLAQKKKKKNQKLESPEEAEESAKDILNQEEKWFREDGVVDFKRDAASLDRGVEKFEIIEKKYKTTATSMNVTKEVTQALLEKTKLSKGTLLISPKGKVRLEITEPERSLLVMNGKNIWVVDYPLDGMQNKVQILHGKVNKSLKNQAFLGFLLGQDKILSQFQIEDKKPDDTRLTYTLRPKKKNEDVQKLEIQMDIERELITSISYWDQLGNKTELKFSKHSSTENAKDKFEFTPPKDAEITEL